MIIVFIGPPKSGKGIQVEMLGRELNLPVFSMGDIIRQARRAGNKRAVRGFEEYSMKGFHLPISLKFGLLKEKLDGAKSGGFILDNFPATQEDLDSFIDYLNTNSLRVNKVFYIQISIEEMMRRAGTRGREDDAPEVIMQRRRIQDEDRKPVIDYFRQQGILEEIDGEREIGVIHGDIMSRLEISRQEKKRTLA